MWTGGVVMTKIVALWASEQVGYLGVTFRGATNAQHDVHGRPSLGSLNGSCIAGARSEDT